MFRRISLGWWGCPLQGQDCSSKGMAEALAERLGHPVDPSDILLDWALTQAGDDREPPGRWQNGLYGLASGSQDAEEPRWRWRLLRIR